MSLFQNTTRNIILTSNCVTFNYGVKLMTSLTRKIQDQAVDSLEKCSSPASRAGSVVERVGKMNAGNVSHAVIALQLTTNSPTGKTYTVEAVAVLCNVYNDSRSGTLVTAKQATTLIEDVRNNDWDGDLVPSMC